MAVTARFGSAILRDLFLTKQLVTGHIQIMAGPGSPITVGAGRRSTTVAGPIRMNTAGSGFQVTNGLLPGFAGAAAATITAGRHWLQV